MRQLFTEHTATAYRQPSRHIQILLRTLLSKSYKIAKFHSHCYLAAHRYQKYFIQQFDAENSQLSQTAHASLSINSESYRRPSFARMKKSLRNLPERRYCTQQQRASATQEELKR